MNQRTQDDPERFFDSLGSINVVVFTPAFRRFFASRLNNESKNITVGTLSGYRSTMKHLYRQNNLQLPVEYNEKLKTFFSGLMCTEAETLQSGRARRSAMALLTYSKYEDLCRETISLLDGGFAHLFLTTQWNLICRSKSVQTLQTEHISFEDDSISCMFFKTKTNQEESAPKDPRHIYGNPYSPIICWLTALGIYFACNSQQDAGALFPG